MTNISELAKMNTSFSGSVKLIAFNTFFLAAELFAAGDGGGGLMDPSKDMVIWTWVTFLALLAILWKFAWGPILASLDKRESDIRDSVDNAAKIKSELETLEATKEKIISSANEEAKDIVANARKAAVEASKVIDGNAKEKAKILIENTTRELKAEEEKARAILRKESADLAMAIAGKLIDENLDDEKNRQLTDKVIKEMA